MHKAYFNISKFIFPSLTSIILSAFSAALMGFYIMGEIPTISTCIGGLMIITGLILFKKANSPGGKNIDEDSISTDENV